MLTSAVPPKAGPSVTVSGPGRVRESSRSSRRRQGSTAPVVLGGGFGVLGTSKAVHETMTTFQPPLTRPFSTSTPQSTTVSINLTPSSTEAHFAAPTTASLSNTRTTTPTPSSATLMFHSPPPSLGDRAHSAPLVPLSDSLRFPGSTHSISSTVSSSSSRTLKTPPSKLEYHHSTPMIVTSSGSLYSQVGNSPPRQQQYNTQHHAHSRGHAHHQHHQYHHTHQYQQQQQRQQQMKAVTGIGAGSRERSASAMETHLMMEEYHQPEWSPTPANRLNSRRSFDKLKNSPPVAPLPAMTHGPLPPTPSSTEGRSTPTIDSRSARSGSSIGTIAGTIKPLHFKKAKKPHASDDLTADNHRLSQGWMQIDEFGDIYSSTPPRPVALPASTSGGSTIAPSRNNLPTEPTMVPMKADGLNNMNESPTTGLAGSHRPRYDRSQTEPPLSPTEARVAYKIATKYDPNRMRSVSPTPLGNANSGERIRKLSLSTPPEDVLAFSDMGPTSQFNMFRTLPGSKAQPEPHSQRQRRSEDLVRRASNDALRYGEYHHHPHHQTREPTPISTYVPLNQGEEKKSSGLSFKKSSGALKALFRGNNKGKEKESSSVKSNNNDQHYGSMSMGRKSSESKNRSSNDELRLRTSTSRSRTTPGSSPALSTPLMDYGRRTPDSLSGSGGGGHSQGTGRSSFTLERSLYPTPPQIQPANSTGPPSLSQTPPLQVTVPSLTIPSTSTSSRDLPPLPPPSPVQSTFTVSSPSSVLTPIDHPASLSRDRSSPTPSPAGSDITTVSARSSSTVSSTSTPRPALSPSPYDGGNTKSLGEDRKGSSDWSPIKPSKSLQLLSLPDLDLDFNVVFDSFGSSAPSTPRRSPKQRHSQSSHTANGSLSRSHSISFSPSHPKSPRSPSFSPSPSPGSSKSPTRSRSIHSSSHLNRTVSEKRGSKSFDAGDDEWRPLGIDFQSSSMAKFFALPSSSSALILAPPAELPLVTVPTSTAITAEASNHSHTLSDASQQSGPSSSDHTGTPSDAASTHQTSSPSPPHTPEDRSTPQLPPFGFDGLSLPSSTTKSIVPQHQQQQQLYPQPQSFQQAQQIHPARRATAAVSTISHSISSSTTVTIPPEIAITISMSHSSGSLAPAALIEDVEFSRPVAKSPDKAEPRQVVRVLQSRSIVVVANPKITINVLAREMEVLLYSYRYPATAITSGDRSTIIRDELIPCLLEVEKRSCGWDRDDSTAWHALRDACFEWADLLLHELSVDQPAHERGACLEGLGAILESSCMSTRALEDSRATGHKDAFKMLLIRVMNYVMDKLGAKGVFHNTLLFSGRFLAFAFFRIPHIAEQLVTVLQPPRGALARFTGATLMGTSIPPEATPEYPAHLLPLCFDNARAYNDRLANLSAEFNSEEERDAFLFTPGNWLRRWQSDDSELFPAFYRAYHRQLAIYLAPAVEYYEERNLPLPASLILRAPGYAHLATIFANKCHSYILGSVNAVTTSSSSQNFEATETAGFKGSQKPAVLDTANRRLVETLATFANMRVMIPCHGNEQSMKCGRVIECDGTQMWTEMLDLWTKSLIRKTNLYAPKGVFCLFDLLDGIVDAPTEVVTELTASKFSAESLLDIPYLIHMIRLILTEGEHALTLVKAIAFVFTHWEVLTARADDRRELCLEVLLEKTVFEKLLLFWSQSVRSYVLRLVVFRLGHLHTRQEDGESYQVEIESVKLLQTRLDKIKKRHDELEPRPPSDDEHELEQVSAELGGGTGLPPLTPADDRSGMNVLSGSGMTRSRSTIHMVADSPRSGSANKAERLLGLGFVGDSAGSGVSGLNLSGDIEQAGFQSIGADSGTKVGKATNWFKRSFGGGSSGKTKTKKATGPGSSDGGGSENGGNSPNPNNATPSPNPSPSLGSSPILRPNPTFAPGGAGAGGSNLSPSATMTGHSQSPSLNDVSPLLPPSCSPNLGISPKGGQTLSLPSSRLENSAKPAPLASPIPSSNSPDNNSPVTPTNSALGTSRKARPPQIQTDVANANAKAASPTASAQSQSCETHRDSRRHSMSPAMSITNPNSSIGSAHSPSAVAFEFELPTASPRSDTFDPAPTPTPSSPSNRRSSQPPSPHQPQSPHMSRSFSKRSSLLPPSTASALDSIMASGGAESSTGSGKSSGSGAAEVTRLAEEKKLRELRDPGYDKKLHAYAIRMLAELEDAQKEYDEWWADGGIGKMDGAPPRLVVAWPFHDEE